MRAIICTLSLLAACHLDPSLLRAQDAGRIGIIATALGSTSVGVIWHVSTDVALRPAITMNDNSVTVSSQSPGGPFFQNEGSSQWNVGGEITLNCYLVRSGAIAPYVMAGGGYSAGKTTQDTHQRIGGSDTVLTISQASNMASLSAGIGVQYALAGQLHLVAEITAAYSRTTTTVNSPGSFVGTYQTVNDQYRLVGTSIGAIFYFK
ncbi:MAG: hypothetical protein JST22_09735 [Bacteroidetes bacterium]|nr:hypothetical protein [Bacteroidota bacterium]